MITNLGDLISSVENFEKLALIDLKKERPRFFTYRNLSNRINAVSNWLKTNEFDTQYRIGILSDNSAEFLFSFFGSLKYGAEVVLISKKFKEDQIKKIIAESRIKLIFSDVKLNTDIQNILLDDDYLFDDVGPYKSVDVSENKTAFIMYTSGSSGSPKPVYIKHKDHIRNIVRVSGFDSWSKNRISLIASPLYHSSGITSVEGSLYGSSTIVMLPKFSTTEFLETVEKFKINTIFCVPSMLAMISAEKKKHNLDSVRTIRSASAPLTDKLISDTKQLFVNAKIINSYGCTELGPGLFGPHPLNIERPELSVGHPVDSIKYQIIDDVLHVRFNENEEWFNTGDRFRIDDNGFYYFLGRSDDMYKSGGNKIYPLEVEKILDSHDCVLLSAVICLEDEIKGFKPYAFVIPKLESRITESELQNYFLKNYPEYLHPRKIWFLSEFPMTGSNKINKQQLKETAIDYLTTG